MRYPALKVRYQICYSVQISLFPWPVVRPMFTDGFYALQVSVGGGQDNLTSTSTSASIKTVQVQVQVQEQVRAHFEHVRFELGRVHFTYNMVTYISTDI